MKTENHQRLSGRLDDPRLPALMASARNVQASHSVPSGMAS